MSNGAAKDPSQGLPALEAAVNRAVEELKQLRRRAAEAAQRSTDLEELLHTFQSGAESPERMKEKMERLEAENRDLRARIVQGRDAVERLIARIQFLEDQK